MEAKQILSVFMSIAMLCPACIPANADTTDKETGKTAIYYFLAPDNRFDTTKGAKNEDIGSFNRNEDITMKPWLGTKIKLSPETGLNIYKIENIPTEYTNIVFNSYFNVNISSLTEDRPYACQTDDLTTTGCKTGECPYDKTLTTDSFDGCIYVFSLNDIHPNPVNVSNCTSEAWFALDNYRSNIDYYSTSALTENTDTETYHGTYGDYAYDINSDNTVTITSYSGSDSYVNVPDRIDGRTVTCIGDEAFKNNTALKSIDLPKSVTTIGNSSFENCTGMKSILGPGLTSIGESSFAGCSGFNGMTFYSSMSEIGRCAMANCSGLEHLVFKEGMTEIPEYVFWNCTNVKTLTIPESLTTIGESAFGQCTGITEISYAGSESQWKQITIESGNESLKNAVVHYGKTTSDVICGDADGDGKISAKDSMTVQRHVVKIKKLGDSLLAAADVNGDDKVTNKDSLEILRFTIKLSNNDRIGKPTA